MKLYRRRYIPDEMILLDKDEIIYHDGEIMVTRWRALKPRPDFSHGSSYYMLDKGIKISKKLDDRENLLEHYCDIVEFVRGEDGSYIFNDLLIDVIVKPDGSFSVADMDELRETLDDGVITSAQAQLAIDRCDWLLEMIREGNFDDYITDFERILSEHGEKAAEENILREPKKTEHSTVVPLDISDSVSMQEQLFRGMAPPAARVKMGKKTSLKRDSASAHSGHRDRVRERYLRAGIEAFADHEIIEFLLFYCVPRGDVNPLAHRMLEEYGSLFNLLDSSPEDIANRCSVSIKTAVLISMINQVHKRYETSKWSKRQAMDSSKKAAAYLYSLFNSKQDECMYMLCLDNQQRLLHTSLISEGTVNETTVYPRNIVKTVLKHNALYVIIAHNHPSGILVPSQGDISTTATIMNALNTVGVELIDHLIISGMNYYSFSEKKMMGLVYSK